MKTAERVKERPILFSAEMVKAILDGRKTMTRRIVKLHGLETTPHVEYADDGMPIWCQSADGAKRIRAADPGYFSEGFACPYGWPGDRLWVRETWSPRADIEDSASDERKRRYLCYRADGGDLEDEYHPHDGWRPSIHMPRWASRLTLELTAVRVERVQEISAKDVVAEGVEPQHIEKYRKYFDRRDVHALAFAELWQSIHGPDAWQRNDFVWVLSFNRIDTRPRSEP